MERMIENKEGEKMKNYLVPTVVEETNRGSEHLIFIHGC